MTNDVTTRLRERATPALLGLMLGLASASFDLQELEARDHSTGSEILQNQTLATAPKSTISLEDRGDIYMARKSYAEAVDSYSRVLKQPGLSPRDQATVWNKIGIALQQEINFPASRRAYKESIRLRSDFAEPWNNLGTTYFMENKFKQSVKYYVQSVKISLEIEFELEHSSGEDGGHAIRGLVGHDMNQHEGRAVDFGDVATRN